MSTDPKFEKFDVSSMPYKVVNDQEIPAHVLVPKGLTSGKRPIVVRFHGGFLISGAALFPGFVSEWLLDYTILHNAILIAPDYRLLPESNGLDQLSDLADFWTWIQKDLAPFLNKIGSEITPDIDHILSYGESAGGYLCLQSAITQPPGLIKAAIAAYPMVTLDSPRYSTHSATRSVNDLPQQPVSVVDDHLAAMEPGKIVIGAFPPARMMFCVASVQQGRFSSFFGTHESLLLVKVLDKLDRTVDQLPFIFIYHGREDTAVPPEESTAFVEKWESKFGKGTILGILESGKHGMDKEATLETPWLKAGLAKITKIWLGV